MIQLQLNDNFKTISLLENTRAIYTPIHVKYQKMNQTKQISPYEMGNISDTDWKYRKQMSYTCIKKEHRSNICICNAISLQMALDKETETNMNDVGSTR